MKRLLGFLLLFLPALVLAESQTIPGFRGLNNSAPAILIGDSESQDLLNVDFTLGAGGIKKRSGYAQFRTIGVSTWATRGGYFFRDTAGVDTLVFANNQSIFESVGGGAFSAFVTTDTAGSYYDFTDSQGYVWRANSSRDTILRYDGANVTYYASAPKGNQIEATASRLVISGTSGNPNRINFSAEADFTDFATGVLETSAFYEDVLLPGQSVNAIKAACGGVLAWSKDSMSLVTAQSQFDQATNPTIPISATIGTIQPSTVIQDYGITYWQGQDGHFYSYDCNVLSKISEKLDVSNFVAGSSRFWTATSQTDFEAGTIGTGLSASASAGNIVFGTTTIDAFTDGDYTASPAWTAFNSVDSGAVSISGNQVDFNLPTGLGSPSIGLRTANTVASNGIWSMDFKFSAAGSGSSFIFKMCSENPSEIGSEATDDCYGFHANGIATFLFENATDLDTDSISFSANTTYNLKAYKDSGGALKFYIDGNLISSATDGTISTISTISIGGGYTGNTHVYADNVSFQYISSAYQTPPIPIGTAITSWGRLEVGESADGATITYAVYADTDTSITLTNAATFTSSQTITNNSLITLAVSPYLTVVASIVRTGATQTPTISDITVNWDEGAVVRHFGHVDRDHRLIFSVAEGNTTVANKSYIYDPRFDSWLRYDFPLSAPARVGEFTYFGGVSTGVVYLWPSGETDDGSAITAYWKSKDFISGNPFIEKNFLNYSFVGKESIGSNIDIVRFKDGDAGTTVNFSLTDPISTSLRQINASLPSGTFGRIISWKFGNDDASAPFELYGFSYDYTPRPWRVLP